MPDIFISYSRKDSEQATMLAEMLSSAGLSCWMDREGIDLATSWSKEIVQAIDGCRAFVVLLSPNSNESHNVIKEVSLAAEQKKKILPLDLEPVALSEDLRYHLAGIQRAPMTNIDAIIRALGKLGLEATGAPQAPTIAKDTGGKKSLMILPFEDLSPTGDNGWFADGIANELISALSNIKALRVADQQATKDYKRYTGTLPIYARETAIRYFVQGDVRKFGDQIKISVSLLDIETGDHLWQEAMKGTMQDIFDIQEKVAEKVVQGLNASHEQKVLSEQGTENAEAYELFMRGREYFERNTREGLELAVQLWSEAIAVDPGYARVYTSKANALAALYRTYTRDPKLLEEGLALLKEARRIKPDLWTVNYPLSVILLLQGKHTEAVETAKEYVQNAPQDYLSHFALGFVYSNSDQRALAVAPYEEALKLKPDDINAMYNLVICAGTKDKPKDGAMANDASLAEKQRHWALIAIPKYEQYLKLFPDNEGNRVIHALLLKYGGRDEDARVAAKKLDRLSDARSLYSIACLHCMLKDYSSGLSTLRTAIEKGYRNIWLLKLFLDDEDNGIGALKGTPEWEDVWEIIERIETGAEE